MSLLLKENPREIYEYFTTKLSKTESIFLIGYYYFNNGAQALLKDEYIKYQIIGQQFLTFAQTNPVSYKKYNFKDESISLSAKDFYTSTDKINESINKNFKIDNNDVFLLEDIKLCLDNINQNLEDKLMFNAQVTKNNLKISVNKQNGEYKKHYIPLKQINLSEYNQIIKIDCKPFTKLFKAIHKILIVDNNQEIPKYPITQINEGLKVNSHPKFDGIWINKAYNAYPQFFVYIILFFSRKVKINGYIYLSFQCGKMRNNSSIVKFTYSTFSNFLSDNNLENLEIYNSWISTDSSNNNICNKFFNVILKKIDENDYTTTSSGIPNFDKIAKKIEIKKTKQNIDRENFHYFFSKFRGEPKLLDFEHFSRDERSLLCKLSESQEIIKGKKYSGIWINDCYSLLTIDELTSNLNYLASALVENGIMFLSFPFVSGLIKEENDKSVSFNETMFKKYFKDKGFKSMKILDSWNKQYYLNYKSDTQIKSFNVLLTNVNKTNK